MILFRDFYQDCSQFFSCHWLVEPPSLASSFSLHYPDQPLISYLNPLRGALISVFDSSHAALLADHSSAMGIMASVDLNNVVWREPVQSLPILATSESATHVIDTLMPYLQKYGSPSFSLHGVMMDIFGKGVLLLGPSGTGKSDCALQLLQREHRLISDDHVRFYRFAHNIVAFSEKKLHSLLEIRGLGVIDVHQWFGPCATLREKAVDLIITLASPDPSPDPRPLEKKLAKKTLLGISIPHLHLPPFFKRDGALLVENAVKFAFSSPSVAIDRFLIGA